MGCVRACGWEGGRARAHTHNHPSTAPTSAPMPPSSSPHRLSPIVPLIALSCPYSPRRPLTDASLFLLLYGVTAVYFSGVMVRLMLVLAPAACCLAGLALSELLQVGWGGLGRAVHAGLYTCVMVRLMLVLAPAACCLAGLALSELLQVGGVGWAVLCVLASTGWVVLLDGAVRAALVGAARRRACATVSESARVGT